MKMGRNLDEDPTDLATKDRKSLKKEREGLKSCSLFPVSSHVCGQRRVLRRNYYVTVALGTHHMSSVANMFPIWAASQDLV